MIIVTDEAREYLLSGRPGGRAGPYRIALNDYTAEGIDLQLYPDRTGELDEVIKVGPIEFVILKSEVRLVTAGDLLIDLDGPGDNREPRLQVIRRKTETGEELPYDPEALERLKRDVKETDAISDGAKTELYFQIVELQGLGKWFQGLYNRVIPSRREMIFPPLVRRALELAGEHDGPLKVLDVGSGSASTLLYGHDRKLYELTCIDLLAGWYSRLHEIFHIEHAAPFIAGVAEQLDEHFPAETFDIVHTSGALDHTESPYVSMEQMHRVTKSGGLVVVASDIREGTNRNWVGLHQHDLYLDDDGDLTCTRKDGYTRSLVRQLGLRPLFHHRAGDEPGRPFEVIYQKA
jgi:SAM-dependent methyltransferase